MINALLLLYGWQECFFFCDQSKRFSNTFHACKVIQ